MAKDMTVGKPSRILLSFSMPMLLSVIFQQLYNMADSIIAGKFDGEKALAAIGVSYPITMIFMGIALGGSVGCTVIISNLFGAKEYKEMKCAVSTGFTALLSVSLVLTVVGVFFSDSIISLLDTPADIAKDAAAYMDIYVYGLFFLFLYNVSSAAFTALGDSKTPLYLLLGSSVTNIVLDLLFVAQFGWGVKGVAWATFISQSAASVISAAILYRNLKRDFGHIEYNRFTLPMLWRISKLAVPSILQHSFVSVGNLFVQGVVNSFDTSVIAGYSAAIKLNTFVINCITSQTNAMSAFTAQNLGARKPERVIRGYKFNVGLIFLLVLPASVFFYFFPKYAALIFLEADKTMAISAACAFLTTVGPFYFFVGLKLLSDSVNRGAGCVNFYMISTFFDLTLRVVLCNILGRVYGYLEMFWCWPIGWLAASALAVSLFLTGKWKKERTL